MGVTPTTADSAINRDDPGQANPAQKDPLVQPNGARPRDTPRQHLSVGHADGHDVNLPDMCNRYRKNGS